jgi:peptidoglycan/LPS O-acetylase OafA/YrhL
MRPAGRPWQPDRRPEFDMMRAWAVAGLVVFHSALVFAAGASWFVKDPRPSAGFAKDASTQLSYRLRFA